MATMSRVLLVALAALLFVVGPCHARPVPQPTASLAAQGKVVDGITAIYNFGDSLSDTGNLLREGDVAGMLQYTTGLPYGSAIGGATGRCSDGYLIIDFLAKDLGLPLLKPYLDKGADFTHGVNFAVAGATALDAAALTRRGVSVPHTNSSLAVQLQWFKDFVSANAKSPQEIREKLAHSLVMVGEIGGNDYNYAFVANKPATGGERNLYNVGRMVTAVVEAMTLVPDVVSSVTSASRELLDMGATRLVIPGNFPLGCVPSYMAVVNETDPAAYDGNGCLASLNLFAQMHNVLLQQGIRELRASYPSATIAYADYFYVYVQMLRDASKMGFDKGSLTKACCGAGAGAGAYNFGMDRMCGAPGASVCARPDERISWDGVHLTQRAYSVMSDLLYHRGFASPAPVEFPRL
ncbi:acetylajmalan esterase-like [Phragmites australis]|uniref:acetylajmalan esterase-like n=1 Tax=Phragmites australis TaxID=29695 RepID=UPI002D7664C9|nr:acetylajmalan esterase-like [Phragmites australis]